MKKRHTLTLDNAASPFGCCGFFNQCGDGDLMSLIWDERLPLLDLLGFEVSNECLRVMEYITFVRAERGDSGAATPGWIADPCADPYGYEFGTAELMVKDFGRVGRTGNPFDLMKGNVNYCKTSPVYRKDGSVITNELEWRIAFATNTIIQDMRRLVINGQAVTPGQFNGLEWWVSTNHGDGLDSYVVNWSGNDMDGGAGITINGDAYSATSSIINCLRSLFRNIKQRIKWSPQLANQRPRLGDFVLVLPDKLAWCLLDYFTCWSVCAGRQYNEANLQTYEARQFRENLIATSPANMFGDGFIRLEGIDIPLLSYDWGLINDDGTFDMYLLTPSYGDQRIWEGEHLDANSAVRLSNEYGGGGGYSTFDGGRLLVKSDFG
jgi:hypothetical protein